MLGDAVVYVCECDRCHKPMGGITQEELNHIASSMGDGLCFDCDPESAATTPSIFWQWQEGDVFSIGGELYQVQANALWPHARAHERTHERTRARGLSSYTYLNRNLNEHDVLEDLVEYVVCPECHGQSLLREVDGGESCGYCGDLGSIAVWASWAAQIVFGAKENV